MTDCKLPRSMVVQIICRLPPKSLLRFKCIHKSWSSLFDSRHFIAEHLGFHNNQSSSTTILLRRPVTCRETKNEDIVCSLLTLRKENNEDEANIHYDIEDIHFPPSIGLRTRAQFIENIGHTRHCADIVGHCRGIICLSLYHASDLALYNPATKEYKLIPEPCQLPRLREIDFRSSGFGYDPISEDFIIVIVASYGRKYYGEGEIGDRLSIEPQRAEVYTMSTDSWTEINTCSLENEATMFRPYYFQVCHRGNCYYLAEEITKDYMASFDSLEDDGRTAIVWFDTSNRVFHSALAPDPLYDYPAHEFTLTVWNNCVALFGYPREENKRWYDVEESKHFVVWVMGDFDGFTCSWIKQVSIDIEEAPLFTLALWEGNQSILVSPRVRLALYNFATKMSIYLPIYAADHFDATPVASSIVPLNKDLMDVDFS